MRNARIDAEQLASEQRVVISELQGYENSPEYRLGKGGDAASVPRPPLRFICGRDKSRRGAVHSSPSSRTTTIASTALAMLFWSSQAILRRPATLAS